MWGIFSPRGSNDGNKTKASGNGSSNGVYEGTSVSQSKSDPRISELREKHEQMENKINELRELSRKRDAELQTIKETIRDCKDKVACLRQSFGEDNGRTFGFGSISAVFSSSSLRHPGSWKMVGGVVLMLYMLTMNPCFILVPKIPRLYSFLYVITIFYHFVLVTGVPLFRRFAVRMGVQEEVLTFYETALAPWGHAIGAGLCALGLLFLKLKKCAPTGCCSACLQMTMCIAAFLVELAAFSYMENPPQPVRGSQSNTPQKPFVNYVIAGLQGLNIIISVSTR